MSAQKLKKSNITPEQLALYEKLIATHPKIERKDANNPYTSMNGHMFTYLDPTSALVAIRLPEGEREKFLKKYKTTLSGKTNELKKCLVMSYEYVKTLKPKPSKKKA